MSRDPQQLCLRLDPAPRVLRPDQLTPIFAADDPEVVSGTYDVYGFTPRERRAYQRKLKAAAPCV